MDWETPPPPQLVLLASAAATALALLALGSLSAVQSALCAAVVWALAFEVGPRLRALEEEAAAAAEAAGGRAKRTRRDLQNGAARYRHPSSEEEEAAAAGQRYSRAAPSPRKSLSSSSLEDEVFKEVREPPATRSAAGGGVGTAGFGLGLSGKSVKASGEDLVRQLQEMERNSRQGYNGSPTNRLALLEESLSSFQSIEEGEEERFRDFYDEDTATDATEMSSYAFGGQQRRLRSRNERTSQRVLRRKASNVMIYDTSRKAALVFHRGEPSSLMMAGAVKELLEAMNFEVKLVKDDDGGMVGQARRLVRAHKPSRRSDLLLLSFLPSLDFAGLSYEDISRRGAAAPRQSVSDAQESEESDLFSSLRTYRSGKGRPTLIFDFRQDEPISSNTAESLPEHCFLVVGHSRRSSQAVWKNVVERLEGAFLDIQDLEALEVIPKRQQRRMRCTLKYPIVVCKKPCSKHKPLCPY